MAVTRADGADFDAKNAGADLSAKVGYLAKIDTDGDLVLAGNTEMVYGVITEGAVADAPATVQVSGMCKAIAGAAIVAGARVMSDGSGKAVTISGATAHGFGIARSAADADGEYVEIQIDRSRGA